MNRNPERVRLFIPSLYTVALLCTAHFGCTPPPSPKLAPPPPDPCAPAILAAAEHIHLPTARPTVVEVALDGARVTRDIAVQLEPGAYILEIPNIPASAAAASLQVSVSDATAVLCQPVSEKEVGDGPSKDGVDAIEAQVKEIGRWLEELKSKTALARQREEYIDATAKHFQEHGGAGTSTDDKQSDIRAGYTFVFDERTRLLAAKRDLEEQTTRFTDAKDGLSAAAAACTKSPPRARVARFTLALSKKGVARVSLQYDIKTASWEPTYKADAALTKATAEIYLDAVVTQKSKEDWNQVKLKVSNKHFFPPEEPVAKVSAQPSTPTPTPTLPPTPAPSPLKTACEVTPLPSSQTLVSGGALTVRIAKLRVPMTPDSKNPSAALTAHLTNACPFALREGPLTGKLDASWITPATLPALQRDAHEQLTVTSR